MYFGLAASWIWSPCIWPFGSSRKPKPWETGQLVAWQQNCFNGSFPFEGGDCGNCAADNIILLLYTTWMLLREKNGVAAQLDGSPSNSSINGNQKRVARPTTQVCCFFCASISNFCFSSAKFQRSVYKPHSYLHLSLICMIPHHFPSSSKLHVTFEKSEWLLIFCQPPANTEIKYGALEGESCS